MFIKMCTCVLTNSDVLIISRKQIHLISYLILPLDFINHFKFYFRFVVHLNFGFSIDFDNHLFNLLLSIFNILIISKRRIHWQVFIFVIETLLLRKFILFLMILLSVTQIDWWRAIWLFNFVIDGFLSFHRLAFLNLWLSSSWFVWTVFFINLGFFYFFMVVMGFLR